MSERWRDVVDYVGLYAVSNLGRVRSRHGVMEGYWGRYHQVCLSKGIGQKNINTHVLVASAFIGPIKKGMQVNHKDGNKWNNCVPNLEIVNPSENNIHAIRTGLKKIPRGSKWHAAKLVEPQVVRIKDLLAKGRSQTEIAKRYSVHQCTISDIARGLTWSGCE